MNSIKGLVKNIWSLYNKFFTQGTKREILLKSILSVLCMGMKYVWMCVCMDKEYPSAKVNAAAAAASPVHLLQAATTFTRSYLGVTRVCDVIRLIVTSFAAGVSRLLLKGNSRTTLCFGWVLEMRTSLQKKKMVVAALLWTFLIAVVISCPKVSLK